MFGKIVVSMIKLILKPHVCIIILIVTYALAVLLLQKYFDFKE